MNINKIIAIAKQKGFIWQSSEIYGGLSGFYDYGPIGILLKRKIENWWRQFFVKSEESIFEIESSLIMHEKVWKASGHLEHFIDPLTQCKKCNSFYRADDLIEENIGEIAEGLSVDELDKKIKENKIRCPKCKGDLSDVKIFNLMLSSNIGPATGFPAYLRPETAQGIFTNFKNIVTATRAKLPFGVAQIGNAYRNEISPRQWIIRLREFRQMEIEYFFNPENVSVPDKKLLATEIAVLKREEQLKKNPKVVRAPAEDFVKEGIIPNEIMAYFLVKELLWYQSLGIPKEAIRFRHLMPDETPHYSKGNFDMEIKFDFGWKEVVGNAYRADFDLTCHSKNSGVDLSIIENGKKIVPHVVEPSFGIDRAIYATLLYCFREGKDRGWEWFAFPPIIAPYTAAVFPLVSKDGLPEKAKEIYKMLKEEFDVYYDESGSIGRRYARADQIGTPFAITIDYQTLSDNTVTLRNRDDTSQVRIKVDDLIPTIKKMVRK